MPTLPPRSACPHCNARKHPHNRTCGHAPCKEADRAARGTDKPIPFDPDHFPGSRGYMTRRQPLPE